MNDRLTASDWASWPVQVSIPVRWGDMDAFGHVNNTNFFRYFEVLRIAYFDAMQLLDYMERTSIGPILAETQCRFRRPLTYPDTVRGATRIDSIQDDRFSMSYALFSESQQELAGIGTGIVVVYDFANDHKVAMDEELRAAIGRVEAQGSF